MEADEDDKENNQWVCRTNQVQHYGRDLIPAAGDHGLWPWRNVQSCDRDVAPHGREAGTLGFARGAPSPSCNFKDKALDYFQQSMEVSGKE